MPPNEQFNSSNDPIVRVGYFSPNEVVPTGEVPKEFLVRLALICATPCEPSPEPSQTCGLCPRIETTALLEDLKCQFKFQQKWKSQFFGKATEAATLLARISFDHSNRLIEAIESAEPFKCSGQVRVRGNRETFVAPAILFHYVVAHGFRPPEEFIRVVMNSSQTGGV